MQFGRVATAAITVSSDIWQIALLAALAVVFVAAVITALRAMSGLGSPVPVATTDTEAPTPISRWLPPMLVVPVLGLIGIVVYSFTVAGASVFSVGLLVAGAAFLSGGLLGFLFGIPRTIRAVGTTTSAPGEVAFAPNSNLEDISDWLTKILVGLGLVQLGVLVDKVGELAEFLGPALGGGQSAEPFAIAVLILFTVSGFLIFYVTTRLYVGQEFALAEKKTRNLSAAKEVLTGKPAEERSQRVSSFLDSIPAAPAEQPEEVR